MAYRTTDQLAMMRPFLSDAPATAPKPKRFSPSRVIIDHLRAVEGAELVALIREPPTVNGPTRRVSLRTTAEELDASAIARKSAGGGHRQAAGFSSERSVDEIAEFIRREYVAQAGRSDGQPAPAG